MRAFKCRTSGDSTCAEKNLFPVTVNAVPVLSMWRVLDPTSLGNTMDTMSMCVEMILLAIECSGWRTCGKSPESQFPEG